MMTYDEALSKIQKLLKLANSPNANEAATAAAMAQSIMDKYNIEKGVAESDAMSDAPDEEITNFGKTPEGELDGEGQRLSTWRISLANAIAKANACKLYLSKRYDGFQSRATLELIGRPSDVRTTRYVYDWLRHEVDRLAAKESKGMGKTWSNNFRLGCVDTIERKLREQRDATISQMRTEASTSMALVRVNTAIEKFENRAKSVESWADDNMNLRKGAARPMRTDYGARHAGRSAAESITLGSARAGLGAGSRQLS